MEQNDKFGFGSKPCMKEVPPGQHAVIKFGAAPDLIETEFGEKYSFPIVLLSHPSYDTLPLNMEWQSKSSSAKQLYNEYYEYRYILVKKYPHGLQLCVRCTDVLQRL